MSADKRTVSTDALATLGTIITEGGRDAIHLAVEPVIAAEDLYPGQDVGIENGKASARVGKMLGIVDPFIKRKVLAGSMFWLIVYPRQITSLRHVWTHPDFDVEPVKVDVESEFHKSQAWIQEFGQRTSETYNELMRVADNIVAGTGGNSWDHEYLYGGEEKDGTFEMEFWDHYSVIRGVKVPEEKRDSFFSCSC